MFLESYTTTRQDFSSAWSTQQKWHAERVVPGKDSVMYSCMHSSREGLRETPILTCNHDTPWASDVHRSLILGLAQGSAALLSSSLQLLLWNISFFFFGTFLSDSYFLLVSCPSKTPGPLSPASVIEAAGSCHWGDPIWRKPVSQGSYNWGSLEAFGSHPVWCTLATMDTCTTFKLIFGDLKNYLPFPGNCVSAGQSSSS